MLLHLSQTKFDSTYTPSFVSSSRLISLSLQTWLPRHHALHTSMEEASEAYGRKVLRNDQFLYLRYFFFIFSISFRFEDSDDDAPCTPSLPSEMCNDRFTVPRQCFVYTFSRNARSWKHGGARAWIHPSPYAAATWTSAKLTGRARASNTTS